MNYWWGIANGVIGMEVSDKIPDGTKALVNLLMDGIRHGSVNPFLRRVISQDGVLHNDGSNVFTPEEILHMDWLCNNVMGEIPPFESLSEKAQKITRLQGIYRDEIPPEKKTL